MKWKSSGVLVIVNMQARKMVSLFTLFSRLADETQAFVYLRLNISLFSLKDKVMIFSWLVYCSAGLQAATIASSHNRGSLSFLVIIAHCWHTGTTDLCQQRLCNDINSMFNLCTQMTRCSPDVPTDDCSSQWKASLRCPHGTVASPGCSLCFLKAAGRWAHLISKSKYSLKGH